MSLCLSPRYYVIFVKIHIFLSYLILLSITANKHHSSYLEGILSSGFLPTITLPTRLSKNSTLIDNIFINKHERLNFAGILNNHISDHQVVAVDMDLVIPPNKTYYITVFSNSDQTKQNFKNDSHSISAFEELKILKLEDLYMIQLYKIYYKNTNNILPTYFQTFTPHYYNALEYCHDLRHNVVRLPITKREYYVQCTKYQFLNLIRDTSQSDLDRSLTSSLPQFIGYFKYSIIESHTPQCTVRNCFVCARQ